MALNLRRASCTGKSMCAARYSGHVKPPQPAKPCSSCGEDGCTECPAETELEGAACFGLSGLLR